VVLPLTNATGLWQERSCLKARKKCWEIAAWVTVGCMRGTTIAVALKMACSRSGLVEDALHKYLGRVEVLVEGLESLTAGHYSFVAAAAAAGLDDAVLAVAAEARASEGFVAGHQMILQTWTWTWETGEG
jgi:hypothetical protein